MWSLIFLVAAAIADLRDAEASTEPRIVRQIELLPGHPAKPYTIMRALNGDLIFLGSKDDINSKAWGARLTPSGQVKWDFLQSGGAEIDVHGRSIVGQRFYGAVEMPNETIVLCGEQRSAAQVFIWLVKLDKTGRLLAERLLPSVRQNALSTLHGCHGRTDGLVLMGTVSGHPGTAWMTKLDLDFNAQWTRFNDDFGLGDFVETTDDITALGWRGQDYFIVKMSFEGTIIAKHLLPDGEQHLVQGRVSDSTVRVVSFISTSRTEVFSLRRSTAAHGPALHDAQRGGKQVFGVV